MRRAQAGPPGREALERNAPNLLAHYLYLWETTVVQQAIETARASVSSGAHSSSYWTHRRHRGRAANDKADITLLQKLTRWGDAICSE